jgi:hypothetical protein
MAYFMVNAMGRSFDGDWEIPLLGNPDGPTPLPAPLHAVFPATGRQVRELPLARNGCS